MKNNKSIVNKLATDVKKTEKQIEQRNLYNIRNTIITIVLKSGIAIDYALPFIISSLIILNIYLDKKNPPFIIDNIKEKANVETIDTSNGINIKHISYDFNYDEESLEHSTKWIIDENNLYERTSTSYKINDEINLNETKKILSMSKEELDNILDITNIETIYKSVLTPDDEIYNDDILVITNHTKSETETITRPETPIENVLNTSIFLTLSLCCGFTISIMKKHLAKTSIKDKLKEYEQSFNTIKIDDLNKMKQLLKIKKQNLIMLSKTATTIKDNKDENYQYVLRNRGK